MKIPKRPPDFEQNDLQIWFGNPSICYSKFRNDKWELIFYNEKWYWLNNNELFVYYYWNHPDHPELTNAYKIWLFNQEIKKMLTEE